MTARSHGIAVFFALFLAMFAAFAAMFAEVIVTPVSAAGQSSAGAPQAAAKTKYPPLKCRIGKPSYCFKYGGSRCLATNAVPKREAACESWTEACLECHRDIPDCFGKVRPLAGTPQCAACDQRWLDCMHRADARYWPDRLKPTPED